jgi:glyoxylase-like metal-dependent hydrolase (beta-lactamase superfamily II)/8-oxo-dGTP pyrophosphatase MutT (NUDIX family)
MSEPLPGLPKPPPPSKPRDAAAVLMFRRTPDGPEVFWVRRESTMAFAAGFYAFPGGRVDPRDAGVPVDGEAPEVAVFKVAAARELFEETGVLVARGGEKLSAEALQAFRIALIEKKVEWGAELQRLNLKLRGADFLDAGRWITPAFLPHRFDCRFFLFEASPSTEVKLLPGELAEGAWVKPAKALARWEEGSALLHPPNLHGLQRVAELTESTSNAALSQKLKEPPNCPGNIPSRIEFQRGVLMFPLETPTLPPATHTNCYVLGNGELLIVDPGAAAVRQYARLLALVSGLKGEGRRPKAVVLTHHHSDHVGGAQAVAERLNIPIWCHEWTAERLRLKPGRTLKDGEVLTLAGIPTMSWKVLHTPGHAKGHLCLMHEGSRATLVGDMVAGIGTIVIDPPEGDMFEYMEQLKRLKEIPVGSLYPSHGPAMADGPAKLQEYLRHREVREHKVMAALGKNGASIAEVVPKAYNDVDASIFPLAERSTHAILIKLVRDGKVTRKEGRYYPADA